MWLVLNLKLQKKPIGKDSGQRIQLIIYSKKGRLDDLEKQQKLVVDEKNKIEEAKKIEFQKKWQETLSENKKIISDKIPNYFHADEGTKIQNSIRKYAMDQGLTEQEIDSMVDARAVKILYDAMLYDQLQKTQISKKKI